MEPNTKYLMADSAATPESRSNATMAYRHSDISSKPEHKVIALEDQAALQVVGGIHEHGRNDQDHGNLQDLRHPIEFEQAAERDNLGRQRLNGDQYRSDDQTDDRQPARPAPLRVIQQQVQHQNGAGRQR